MEKGKIPIWGKEDEPETDKLFQQPLRIQSLETY